MGNCWLVEETIMSLIAGSELKREFSSDNQWSNWAVGDADW
jgi:hypothetical protein